MVEFKACFVIGGMVGWWDGEMVEWWDGGMVGWWVGGMVGIDQIQ